MGLARAPGEHVTVLCARHHVRAAGAQPRDGDTSERLPVDLLRRLYGPGLLEVSRALAAAPAPDVAVGVEDRGVRGAAADDLRANSRQRWHPGPVDLRLRVLPDAQLEVPVQADAVGLVVRPVRGGDHDERAVAPAADQLHAPAGDPRPHVQPARVQQLHLVPLPHLVLRLAHGVVGVRGGLRRPLALPELPHGVVAPRPQLNARSLLHADHCVMATAVQHGSAGQPRDLHGERLLQRRVAAGRLHRGRPVAAGSVEVGEAYVPAAVLVRTPDPDLARGVHGGRVAVAAPDVRHPH
mmetsp:Transcript_47361/g.133635  ORF Transcript_47361/g.133635 Transcript_47361/m.133635 type:complete len:296 (+) Transcript_47361:405-1292(+)